MVLPVGGLMGALKGAGKLLKGRKKQKPQLQKTGKQVAGNITGKKEESVKQQTSIIFPIASSTQNIIESTGSSKASSPEAAALEIHRKTIKIRNLLKGSLVLDKMREKNKIKASKKAKRTGAEDTLEKKASKGKFGLPIPGAKKVKGLWERLKDFFLNILWGWIAVRLVDHGDKIGKWLPKIGKFADFMIDLGVGFVDTLASAVKAGYDAYDWTRENIVKTFGGKTQAEQEQFAAKFDDFMGTANKVMNLVIALGMAAAAMAMTGRPRGPQPPRRGPKNRLRRTRTRARRFFKPNAEAIKRAKRIKEIAKQKRIAAEALKRQRLWRKIRPTNLRRTSQVALEKTSRAIQGGVQNLQKTKVGQTVTEVAEKIDPRKWKMPKVKTPAWMKRIGGTIKKGFANADAWIKSIPAKTRQLWDDVGKKIGPYIDEMGEGITQIGKSIGSKWDEATKNMKPQKVIDDLMAKVKPAIDDILKKNPIISQIATKLNPKNAKGAIRGLLTQAASNPALKKIIDTLKANKGASKGLGPIDKIIAALLSLADYTLFKESPINAILKGLGGLLGYGVGFSAATAVPVLGQSGIFNFMGGMAGGIAGEWLAMKIAKGLALTPLGDIDDPIMGPKDIEQGLPARKLVRDPDGLLDHMIKGKGPKVKEEPTGNIVTKTKMDDATVREILKLKKQRMGVSRDILLEKDPAKKAALKLRENELNMKMRKLEGESTDSSGNVLDYTKGGSTYETNLTKKAIEEESYHKGGWVPGKGERLAKLLGGEIVIDVDSAGPAKDMLLAINQASTYEGIVDAIRKFAPYDAMVPETIRIPNSKIVAAQQKGRVDQGTKVQVLPIFESISEMDPYSILYKGS